MRNFVKMIWNCLLFIAFSLSVISCASVSVGQNSKPNIIENVPFYPQKDYQCGPAALAGVLNYWGVNITADEIAKEIYSRNAKGTLTIDMINYPSKKGLYTLQYVGSWDDLKSNIDIKRPLIVLVDYGIFSVSQANHFMVVIGYSDEGVIVNSEKTEKLFLKKEKFLKMWKKTNYWTLLIMKYQ